MPQNSFKKLRYTAASINLFGLTLSVGTWGYRVWLRTHTPAHQYPTGFTWPFGIFCWVFGLTMFVTIHIVEGFARNR